MAAPVEGVDRSETAPVTLDIGFEPYDGPVARSLVDGLGAETEERYAADGPGDGDDPETAATWDVRVDQVRPPLGAFLVARLGGLPVGCGAVRPLLGAPVGVGEVKRMYIIPEARRRGVARQLLARLEAEAAALGYHRLQLETGMRQPEAIALYEGARYHRVATFGQYAGDELQVCFAKDLRPA